MGGLLCCFTKSRITKLDKIESDINDCKLVRNKIISYIRYLERNDDHRKKKAIEALKNNNKEQAKLFVMQAKMYREIAGSSKDRLKPLEEEVELIETTRIEKEPSTILNQQNKLFNEITNEVDVERLEDIADNINNYSRVQDVISNFLKGRSIDQKEFEEASQKEFEKIMEENNILI